MARPTSNPSSESTGRSAIGRIAATAAVIGIGLTLVGCLSSDSEGDGDGVLTPREAAEELIAGPLASEAGLGPLVASCPEMTGATVGDVFPCTAATETQLTTTNVIKGAALPSFEQAAVDALNATVDVSLGYDAVDCGEVSVVLAGDRMMICTLTDPQTQQIFDISLTIDDIEARQFSLVVADRPRS
jgi:hypothetical protein